jgi:thiamine pyrophosphokinase
MTNTKNIVILLDGEQPTFGIVEYFISRSDIVIATDGAAKYVREMNFTPHIIIGDLDSIDEETRAFYESSSTIIIHEATQYSTDFEKALDHCIGEYQIGSVCVLGIHGKQTDHLMTNFSVLLRYSKKISMISAFDATHMHYFLHEGKLITSIEKPENTKISLMPLPIAFGVRTEGLFYPISNEDMTFGEREGLSNILSTSPARITIASGALLVSVPFSIGT